MLPLGDRWTGLCRAAPEAPAQPDRDVIGRVCNLGYARGSCERFPAGAGPDAARFTVRSADRETVRVFYVLERDHHPYAQGPLEYSVARAGLSEPLADGNLGRQAEAYARSYLRRLSEAARI